MSTVKIALMGKNGKENGKGEAILIQRIVEWDSRIRGRERKAKKNQDGVAGLDSNMFVCLSSEQSKCRRKARGKEEKTSVEAKTQTSKETRMS